MTYKRFFIPFMSVMGIRCFIEKKKGAGRGIFLMKSYYPKMAKKIQEKVGRKRCDLLDYGGSRLYDEYPDRYMLYHLEGKS